MSPQGVFRESGTHRGCDMRSHVENDCWLSLLVTMGR